VTPTGEQVAKRIEVEGRVGSGMQDAKETESSSPVASHALSAGVEGASTEQGRGGGAQRRGDGDAKEAALSQALSEPSPGGGLSQGQNAEGGVEVGMAPAVGVARGGGEAGGSRLRASTFGEVGSHSMQPKQTEERLQGASSQVKPQAGQSSGSDLVHGVVGGQSLHGQYSPGRGIGGQYVAGGQSHQGEGRRLGGGMQSGGGHAQHRPDAHGGYREKPVSHDEPGDSTQQRSPAYPVPPALEEYVSRRQPAAKSKPAAMVSCGASPSVRPLGPLATFFPPIFRSSLLLTQSL